MTTLTMEQALESIYTSLHNDNENIDEHIRNLKAALTAAGLKTAEIDPSRLVQNNRQGRKMMESYFRKRGVDVSFSDKA